MLSSFFFSRKFIRKSISVQSASLIPILTACREQI